MSLVLEDNSTHFNCVGCNKIRPVKKGRITRVAYSIFDSDTIKKFCYRSYYVMVCYECLDVKDRTRGRAKK